MAGTVTLCVAKTEDLLKAGVIMLEALGELHADVVHAYEGNRSFYQESPSWQITKHAFDELRKLGALSHEDYEPLVAAAPVLAESS